ncbi:MAG TPA: prolyl oligopeptidase family serine peptidase [Terriglobales bacterium]|nr:prolyl oligopeptidase family serine peptidase [Terriglobales bacterium]
MTVRARRRLLWAVLAGVLAASGPVVRAQNAPGSPSASAIPDQSRPELAKRTLKLQNTEYWYEVFSPAGHDNTRELPAVVLLHGAGDQPDPMIAAWQDFALRNEIVLLAPALPPRLDFEPIAPEVFRRMVKQAEGEWPINPQRIYVFGHSAGGYLALDAAAFDSDLFAAVAVHASFLAPAYTGILEAARRKTPIALYIGDRDLRVPVSKVEGTRDLLRQRGFPVHYVLLPGHDHNYYALAEQINEDAWRFFQSQRLK